MDNEPKFIIWNSDKGWVADPQGGISATRSSKTKLCHFLNKHTVMTLKEGAHIF